jgi:pyruvate/2-oxoglutarate/acetoin dehydrogenase E1 component/TPP-dependent pyruvate/acetoin dehydrogenase alpha subunit
MDSTPTRDTNNKILFSELGLTKENIISDYRIGYQSRQASLIGRREVLTGKAKFGIFGDGKELPQLAMARAFQNGDFRSGYYRDQTFAIATGIQDIKQFFAQLYADTDLAHDPNSGGRQMNAHFASRQVDAQGNWKDLTAQPNSFADASPTASQMPRLAGLAQASKLYRKFPDLDQFANFSKNGNEVAFGTIGNASCAEGHFWETINAVGVIGAPMIMSVWDDGYGISVPNKFQVTKSNISEVLSGFQREKGGPGYEIFVVNGWDYLGLVNTYQKASQIAREEHVPCLIHVREVTQPQGHSTSGSHERYKSPERLQWEKDYDCLEKMKAWMLKEGIATEEEFAVWEKEDRKLVRRLKNEAWDEYQAPILDERKEVLNLLQGVESQMENGQTLRSVINKLEQNPEPFRANFMEAVHEALLLAAMEGDLDTTALRQWRAAQKPENQIRFNAHLHNESSHSALSVEGVEPVYSDNSEEMPGFEVLNNYFDILFERDPRTVAFGEDVGKLGDVNQGFKGLQDKYGPYRIMDTGIREATIIGQAIGLAARGLRPIAEIQYLDYFIYGLQTLSDDLATLHYRTAGGQIAPAIIRTRGHRLEGIWHAGSPMATIINALRGMHVLVPRNMTKAAGFYNTLMEAEEPAVVVEVLNAYRLKERKPDNLGEYKLPLGVPEIIRVGEDVTLVTYGACCKLALDAASQLEKVGISVEVIDVQSLLPFDLKGMIVESLKKTNRILFLDEDVPGGATAFMMQEVLEKQQGYFHLDSQPRTLTSHPHRPAYGTDGDFFSKPQVLDIFKSVYEMMHEADPEEYPDVF